MIRAKMLRKPKDFSKQMQNGTKHRNASNGKTVVIWMHQKKIDEWHVEQGVYHHLQKVIESK